MIWYFFSPKTFHYLCSNTNFWKNEPLFKNVASLSPRIWKMINLGQNLVYYSVVHFHLAGNDLAFLLEDKVLSMLNFLCKHASIKCHCLRLINRKCCQKVKKSEKNKIPAPPGGPPRKKNGSYCDGQVCQQLNFCFRMTKQDTCDNMVESCYYYDKIH